MKIQADKLKKKIMGAYPNTFPEALKQNGGNYFPMKMPFSDQQIRDQIEMKTFGFEYSFNIVTELLKNINGYRIIDIGCGFGIEAILIGELANDGIEVTALDADLEKTNLLNSVLDSYQFADGSPGKDKITAITGDIFNLDSAERFNGVLIKHVIGYLAQCDIGNYSPVIVENAQLATKDFAKKAMQQVRKIIEQDGWLSVYDRDCNSYTTLSFIGGARDGLKEPSLNYREVPVVMQMGGQQFEEKVIAFDWRASDN